VNPDDTDDHILRDAARIGLTLDTAHVPGVTYYFNVIAGFAATVNEFPLDETVEPAPVFTPCLPPTPE
jgi:hypothetical protein